MVTTSALRALSSANGPSYLLHAMEVLRELAVPQANVRLLPVLGHYGDPEIMPYAVPRAPFGTEPEPLDPRTLSIRLRVNVRADNRLRGYRPLVAVGLPPREALAGEDADSDLGTQDARPDLAESVRTWCEAHYREEALVDTDPEWHHGEDPVVRLIRQLCALYPEMTELIAIPPEAGEGYVRAGRFEPDYRLDWDQEPQRPNGRAPTRRGQADRARPKGVAEELVEVFFTSALTAIAGADLLRGFEFIHGVQPEGRRIELTIDGQSRIEEVAEWLEAYPHFPRPSVVVSRPTGREARQWEQEVRGQPERVNIFDAEAAAWSEDDEAVQALYRDIRRQYGAGRKTPLSATEMVALTEKHVPDWLPNYPRQSSLTGGLNLGGITVRLLKKWLEEGPALGLTKEDLTLFEPHHEMLLWALLLRRRQTDDYRSLFELAARLLVHSDLEVEVERYVPHPYGLGSPLAQLDRTLVLNHASIFHSPEIVVRIHLDRTFGDVPADMEKRLEILRRLFLPIHVPLRYDWGARWVDVRPPVYSLDPAGPTKGRSGEEMPGLMRGSGSALLSPAQLWEPGALAAKLYAQEDPVSRHLWRRLSPETQRHLGEYEEGTDPPAGLIMLLVDDLNRVLHGESLYDPDRFVDVELGRQTLELICRNPTGPALVHLNRFLLQEAYLDEIAESEALAYWASYAEHLDDEEDH